MYNYLFVEGTYLTILHPLHLHARTHARTPRTHTHTHTHTYTRARTHTHTHTHYSQCLSTNQNMQKPLSPPLFSLFLSHQLTKRFPLSYDQKSLIKPDAFDFKLSPSSCYIFILSQMDNVLSFLRETELYQKI